MSALLSTYILSFSCLIWRRLWGAPLPPRRWSLGAAGLFVNVGAVLFLVIVWIFVFFPLTTPVTLETMNWNCLMFGSTMIFAIAYYFAWGRRFYTSPVDLVKRICD